MWKAYDRQTLVTFPVESSRGSDEQKNSLE
jgi:hypothetical protein